MASKRSRSEPEEVVDFLAGLGLARLKEFLVSQRWFAAKTQGIHTVEVEDWTELERDGPTLLLLLRVDGERYYTPLSVSASAEIAAADVAGRFEGRALVDAHAEPSFGRQLLAALAAKRQLPGRAGRFTCHSLSSPSASSPQDPVTIRRISGEQSNTSIVFGRERILKSIRRPQGGINPELEVLHFLTSRTRFSHVPRLAGWIEYLGPSGQVATLNLLQDFIENDGDGWRHTLAILEDLCEALERIVGDSGTGAADDQIASMVGPLTRDIRELGSITGGLHVALASDPLLPAFSPEPVTHEDVGRWCSRIARELESLISDTTSMSAESCPDLLVIRETLRRASDHIDVAVGHIGLLGSSRTHKIRCHGDYHLGQVLKTKSGFAILDFEGEPARPLEERRAKQPPLRDVAGMLRSLNYAVHTTVGRRPPAERDRALGWLASWERHARRAFLDGYGGAVAESPVRLVPRSEEELARACAVFELEKACYELRYELNNRPGWASIPARGILRILESTALSASQRAGSPTLTV
jgi:trehalose synthase-fused probable maltokinase